MTTTALEFSVRGTPITQGSKTPRILGRRSVIGGQRVVFNPRTILIEDKNLATKTRPKGALDDWRARIARSAEQAIRLIEVEREFALIDGPVWLSCEFVFARPPSHWTKTKGIRGSCRNKIPRADLSKLVRAVEDSLTDVAWRDDNLVVRYRDTWKRYSGKRDAVGGVIVRLGLETGSPERRETLANGEDDHATATQVSLDLQRQDQTT